MRRELMGPGATNAHHNALPEHVNTVIQVLYTHQIIRIRHVSTIIDAFSEEVLSDWSELHLHRGNETNQAVELMKYR